MELNLTFDNPADFIPSNPDEIEVAGGSGKLKLIEYPDLFWEQNYSDSTGFVFDPNLAGFDEILDRLYQENATQGASLYASYNYGLELSWGGGSLDFSGTGNVKWIDITGNLWLSAVDYGQAYIDYDAAGNASSQQTICIEYPYVPGYSGSPTFDQHIVTICQANNNENNLISIIHNSLNSKLRVVIKDQVGATIIVQDLGNFNPTSGLEYNISLNMDITAGATRLFVNGIQSGITMTGTGTRGVANPIGLFRIGSNAAGTALSRFEIREIAVYPAVQHTENYTPVWNLYEYRYVENKVDLPCFVSEQGFIQSLVDMNTTDLYVQYIIGGMYWNGSAWVPSDGSWAQSNTVAVIVANIDSLVVENGFCVSVVFANSNTQQGYADYLSIEYIGQINPVTNPYLDVIETFRTNELLTFVATVIELGDDKVNFLFKKDGQFVYYVAGVWQNSDGTYEQSNTIAEIISGLSEYTNYSASTGIRIFLHSNDGSTSPLISLLNIAYSFGGSDPEEFEYCDVWGRNRDSEGFPSQEPVVIKLEEGGIKYKNETTILNIEVTKIPDITGYWKAHLVETSNMINKEGKEPRYKIVLPQKTIRRHVPNKISENVWNLLA